MPPKGKGKQSSSEGDASLGKTLKKKQPVRCRGNKFGFEKINGVLVREILGYYQPENVNGRNIYWKFSERHIERIY